MEEIFFTSDTHFGHANCMKFCPDTRLGSDVDEMDELLIQAWNNKVKPRDRVYHLGDFSFHKKEKTVEIISRLNGHIHLIEGNHDRQLDSVEGRSLFVSKQIYKTITIDKTRIVLMHTPIESWDRMHYGSLHLHGHTHGGFSKHPSKVIKNRMDVGVDTRVECDMAPYRIDEVLHRLKESNDEIEKYEWVRVLK
jgi:calcineurin-like phosphoesterase family protein